MGKEIVKVEWAGPNGVHPRVGAVATGEEKSMTQENYDFCLEHGLVKEIKTEPKKSSERRSK